MNQEIVISFCFWWRIFGAQNAPWKMKILFLSFNFSFCIDPSHKVISSLTFWLAFVKKTNNHLVFPRGLFYTVLSPRELKCSWRDFGQVQEKLAEKDTSTGKLPWVSWCHRFSCSQLEQLKISAHIVSVLFCWLNACRQQPHKACVPSLFFALFFSLTQTKTQTHTHMCTHRVTACQQL